MLTPLSLANDVVMCDPTATPTNSVPHGGFIEKVNTPETPGLLVWIAPNNSMTQAKQDYMNQLRGQIDILHDVVPLRHWICYDSDDPDGIVDSVREMTQAEKDLVEAPRLANQARSQQIDNEKASNTICNAEPSDLDSRIDTAVDNIQNLNDAKQFLRTFTKRLARCVWARTTSN